MILYILNINCFSISYINRIFVKIIKFMKYQNEDGDEINEPTRYKKLSDIRTETKGKTRFLYHLNYWDGPLSGIMLCEDERVYFNCTDEFVK